ncbi:branched-chain amino acid aminotransferase, cytosolic [Talaromyces stipitatus ATCC 10500]|uniref:Branched-chain-amino-acid aminotransferase n=1 Tax=Talaromyces stipitatus (strain ATCC 10500 / CBS 375.48 / QM 6759 / NRRL 1006) TaxID=441959 RepID=B8LUG0_TALSN|nr:branched-chain amino acid aminotransferase, cytosolic [Talaromyces stipitatus ATCC 10500]XP_002341121.1 branched-chain amino acid aminotransferase, cytosolic [Talaromyces stipitatus ATCC 10500]XP_002341122.1 branched-chain amino acid aminotransferase, cytosolic [Talaromyces stipitatus ATCC 10500]EED23733.1 branched-chain amino acid aminotransferase, cytosolic [Talaromyces stipitatus ATCC 10500]EED23734.1 branched-chain amino acid aminotransferase, cytosolic [Talaromyces stipitatus ATCC 10500
MRLSNQLMRNTLLRTSKTRYTASSLSSSLWKRSYSIKPISASTELPALDPSKLEITKTTTPKDLTPNSQLQFGKTFTDHMLTMEWTATDGWLTPRIVPYQNLSLDPATCVFHYAFECFEGMKAYKDKDGKIRLFRPDKNMERLNKSSARIALPTFNGDSLTKLIAEFTKLESRFIPNEKGYSLYLRPTMIGTQKTIGVGPPGSALLFVIASPVGPYYPTGFKAVSLEATDYAVRAWPGGVGDKKLGANYAPCIVPQQEAASRGFQQNLWLFGEEEYVTEVGTMNLFMAIKNKETGLKELLTAPLDGTILEGVTRDTVLALARERLVPEGWVVSERKVRMSEVAEAATEGRLLEVFGSGTAAIVSPVRKISYKGQLVDCGLQENEEAGEIALRMKNWIEGIQYGEEKHPWSYVVE